MRYTGVANALAEHYDCGVAAPEREEGDGADEGDPGTGATEDGVGDTNDEGIDCSSQGVEPSVATQ